MDTLWILPVPSTALLDGGVDVEVRLRREIALPISFEAAEGDEIVHEAIVFQHVEAYRCTFLNARGDSMLAAYDKLVDLGATAWREEVATNLRKRGEPTDDLVHLMITFDDGPCIEAVCRGFRVDRIESKQDQSLTSRR